MNERLAQLYWPLPQAVRELHARRASRMPEPNSELERYLATRPCAVLTRNVATPNFELERFVSLATACGLSPVVLEFHRDKFVTSNPLKYSLGRMSFYGGTGRNGGPRVQCLQVIDLPAVDGLPLLQIATSWGQDFIEFHHRLITARPTLGEVEFWDGSDWFAGHGPNAQHYYTALMALFVQHAILFETFLLTPAEQQFTADIVLPGFEAAAALHGLPPLICRLDPPVTEGDGFWLQYPEELYATVAAKFVSAGAPSPPTAASPRQKRRVSAGTVPDGRGCQS